MSNIEGFNPVSCPLCNQTIAHTKDPVDQALIDVVVHHALEEAKQTEQSGTLQ